MHHPSFHTWVKNILHILKTHVVLSDWAAAALRCIALLWVYKSLYGDIVQRKTELEYGFASLNPDASVKTLLKSASRKYCENSCHNSNYAYVWIIWLCYFAQVTYTTYSSTYIQQWYNNKTCLRLNYLTLLFCTASHTVTLRAPVWFKPSFNFRLVLFEL
jgi:hypothetical protein